MRLQRCFSIRGDLNGLLDVARRTYCEIVEDIERNVADLGQAHGLSLKVGFNAQESIL
jgi:DNA mismatch repair protein MSH4